MARNPTINPVQPTLLDRAIAVISPQWGVERLRNRTAIALAGGYSAGSRSRPAMRKWNPPAADADTDITGDLPLMRARSRDMVRNTPIAGGAINTIVTNVVGTGLTLKANPDADVLGLTEAQAADFKKRIEREWKLWSESKRCDLTRALNFYGLQSLAFRSTLENGDAFGVLTSAPANGWPYTLAVQLIEADRVSNPGFAQDKEGLVAGVELDANGAATGYQVCNRHPGGFRLNAAAVKWTRIPAYGGKNGGRNVLHLLDIERIGQTRGVPLLAPVTEILKQISRLTEAELQAAVNAAAMAIFVKMDPNAFVDLFDDPDQDTYLQSSMQWDGSISGGSDDGPGKAINLLPGEEISSSTPGRPNPEFDPFFSSMVRQVGLRINLPFEVLIKHFTSSYSAARASLLDAWRFFRGRRSWLADEFCQPVYEALVEECVAAGRIAAPGFFADPLIRKAWCGSQWIGDGPGSIDPAKEVSAAQDRVRMGISTLETESILHDGIDWETKHRQRVKEQSARRRDGLVEPPKPGAGNNAGADGPDGTDGTADGGDDSADNSAGKSRGNGSRNNNNAELYARLARLESSAHTAPVHITAPIIIPEKITHEHDYSALTEAAASMSAAAGRIDASHGLIRAAAQTISTAQARVAQQLTQFSTAAVTMSTAAGRIDASQDAIHGAAQTIAAAQSRVVEQLVHVGQEIRKPRRAVIDAQGNPIGTEVVDVLPGAIGGAKP